MADTKVASLTASSGVSVTDLFYADTGAADNKVTAAQLKTFTSASPTLVTPALGTPASGVGTNLTGIPWTDVLEFVIDGGGSALTSGTKGFLEVPFACTINRVTSLADQSGSVVVDIYKCTYSAFDISTHPVSGDKITASVPPTITTAVKAQDATLTGWTTSITAGDVLAFVVTGSPTSITRVTVSLRVTRVNA